MEMNETIVPGRNYSKSSVSNSNSVSNPIVTECQMDSSPVVGFLYSISRQGVGEYWPVKLGRNTIGRSSNCSIQLCEASVSDLHASLSVKIMKSTGHLVASIRDEGSKTGLFLNDQELDYEGYPCKNLDVIVVGASYKLLLILIDAVEYGLSAAENFVTFSDGNSNSSINKHASYANEINNDPFVRPSSINMNETIDIDGAGYTPMEKTKCL